LRVHTVSAVYVAEATGEPRAQDDARNLAIFAPEASPKPLAFDHARILDHYSRYHESGQIAPLWSPAIRDQA
jgi:8-oxo-dGTP diphosphatase